MASTIEYNAQGLAIQKYLNDWASNLPNPGKAVVVPNLKQLYKQAALDTQSLRILIAFGGTRKRSPFNIQNKTRREDCIWKVAVTKGNSLSTERGDFLVESTANSDPFLYEVATVRDLCVNIPGISVESPNDYDDIQPLAIGDLIMAGYMITFSAAHDFDFFAPTGNQEPQ
jgi:hypothetical protein